MFSIFKNINMTIGLMPVAGIILSCMSYVGSSILANFMSLGIVLNVGIKKRDCYTTNFLVV
ncbi:cell division protein FtsW (lipid II flippase) [Clostridium saccharobutylicum]|nr:cell division protein FtsW (lipid II flippase) [Clostridium saccharobutylicum]NOV91935.1 cell division protein FtsW (lipid II flippase) [Clostridium saccharobutylicum]NSB49777.1 cell division protein FtsW (lipid II flippase) [Clostridium saccharobutylicum]NYC99809.1 cell division protein FtsW (lipid II flippase) [Clostridium saccharobutylicum]